MRERVVDDAFISAFRLVMALSGALALGGALIAAATLEDAPRREASAANA